MDICTIEDGSLPGQSFPCLWDAALSGNGTGKSFVLDGPGGIPHYVTEVGADGTIFTNDDPAMAVTAPTPVVEVTVEVGTVADVSTPMLAETGMDPMGAAFAVGLVTIGALLVTIRRLLH